MEKITQLTHVLHTFEPVYDNHSKILILGSFPSVKSRENQFYYGHPQNRFWRVMAQLLDEPVPTEIAEKKELLLSHHIAVWDVIAACDIAGSSDSSIKNVVPNDMAVILGQTDIRGIFANGDKAYQLFLKYCTKETIPPVYKLPSTSPANAVWSVERLVQQWSMTLEMAGIRKEYLKK